MPQAFQAEWVFQPRIDGSRREGPFEASGEPHTVDQDPQTKSRTGVGVGWFVCPSSRSSSQNLEGPAFSTAGAPSERRREHNQGPAAGVYFSFMSVARQPDHVCMWGL